MEERKGTQSVDRALEILCLFADGSKFKSLTEISQTLKLNASTVRRLLTSLMRYGFIEQDETTRKYKLGIRFMDFGNIVASHIDLKTAARPVLEELGDIFHERVHLSIFDYLNAQTICLDMVESTYPVRMASQIGGRGLFHCTGSGKVFAAYLDENELSQMISKFGLPKFTENTISDEIAFRQELIKIRQQGYSFDNGEHEKEIQCIAAPIRGMDNEVVATVSIALPASRIDEEKKLKMIEEVKKAALKISHRIGYREKRSII